MEHVNFFFLNFAVFLIIVLLDRKKYKDYLMLSSIALVLSFIFENFTIYIGLWYYYSEPKLMFFSLYTWLLYIPYISFCYFISNKVVKYF
jgi:FlaA1/EpsC-like NDP-sugar epimerase